MRRLCVCVCVCVCVCFKTRANLSSACLPLWRRCVLHPSRERKGFVCRGETPPVSLSLFPPSLSLSLNILHVFTSPALARPQKSEICFGSFFSHFRFLSFQNSFCPKPPACFTLPLCCLSLRLSLFLSTLTFFVLPFPSPLSPSLLG